MHTLSKLDRPIDVGESTAGDDAFSSFSSLSSPCPRQLIFFLAPFSSQLLSLSLSLSLRPRWEHSLHTRDASARGRRKLLRFVPLFDRVSTEFRPEAWPRGNRGDPRADSPSGEWAWGSIFLSFMIYCRDFVHHDVPKILIDRTLAPLLHDPSPPAKNPRSLPRTASKTSHARSRFPWFDDFFDFFFLLFTRGILTGRKYFLRWDWRESSPVQWHETTV